MVNCAPRRAGRVVEGARLESVYTATYRGFESLALRQYPKASCRPHKHSFWYFSPACRAHIYGAITHIDYTHFFTRSFQVRFSKAPGGGKSLSLMQMVPVLHLKSGFEKRVTREATHASQGKQTCSFAGGATPAYKR